jgi:hypothetical protein
MGQVRTTAPRPDSVVAAQRKPLAGVPRIARARQSSGFKGIGRLRAAYECKPGCHSALVLVIDDAPNLRSWPVSRHRDGSHSLLDARHWWRRRSRVRESGKWVAPPGDGRRTERRLQRVSNQAATREMTVAPFAKRQDNAPIGALSQFDLFCCRRTHAFFRPIMRTAARITMKPVGMPGILAHVAV